MADKGAVVTFILTLWREAEGGDEDWRGTLRPISPRLDEERPTAEAFVGLQALGAAVKAGLRRALGGGAAP